MKLKNKDFYTDDLRTTNWLGEVINNVDPENLGRLKLKIFGKYDNLEEDEIPWAYPSTMMCTGGSASGSGFYSVPKKNSVVNCYFDNGDIYHPIYTYHQKLSDELVDEISNSPENFHSLIYDTEINGGLKLYYTEEKGLLLDSNSSVINIRKDNSIYLEYKNGIKFHITQNMISLGSETRSAEPAVLGDKNGDTLSELADRLNDLTNAIITYATAQAAITGALVVFSPLTPALTALTTVASTLIPLITKIKTISVPLTKSNKITLD